ncbi:MAG: ABC transporter permease subunit [Anaerolineae bacterium]|nr:ABC transporter permease subunit [Anaerolineae bacterium]
MNLSTPSFSLNPLLVKELRGRMRGPRAFLFLTFILVILGLFSYGLFQLATPRFAGQLSDFGNASAGATIGQTVFVGLVFLTLLLVCAIAPSLTAGAISGEHQRKTFDLLMATPLGPFTILSGKLGAALSYVALILLAAVPMTSMAYVFGGVTVSDLVRAFAVMAGFAVVFSVMGLFFSALFLRTGLAVGASYFLVGMAILGTFFVYLVIGVMRGAQPPNWVLALNPFSAMASALIDGVITDPNTIYNGSSVTPMLYGIAGGRFDVAIDKQVPLWQYSAALYTWLTIFLFAIAAQLVKPVQRFRFHLVTWIVLALLFLALLVGALALFAPQVFLPFRSTYLWYTTSERNIVVNPRFEESLTTGWIVGAELGKQVKGSAPDPPSLADADGAAVLRFARDDATPLSELLAMQNLNFQLTEASVVKLGLTLRMQEHAMPVCGAAGRQCPMMILLDYTDRRDQQHKLAQGFFSTYAPDLPDHCVNCDRIPPHVRVETDTWLSFASTDLFENVTADELPRSLDRVTLFAQGTGFQIDVAEVRVLVHEGRPPLYGKPPKTPRWSWRRFVPFWVYDLVYGAVRGWGPVNPGGPIMVPAHPRVPLIPTRAPMPLRVP